MLWMCGQDSKSKDGDQQGATDAKDKEDLL